MTRARAPRTRAGGSIALGWLPPQLIVALLLGLWGSAGVARAPSAPPAAAPSAGAGSEAPIGSPTVPRGSTLAPSSPLPSNLAPLALPSERGQELLYRSRRRADYVPLSQEFLTQATLSYCGVASSVMVLNSLAVPAPQAKGYGPYRFWTQENLFEGGSGGPDPGKVRQRGMTLAQLGQLLAGRGVRATAIEASGLNMVDLRQLLRRSLADPEDRLLVNYDRRGIGQAGGGHISPLAAFDDASDRVLILDVARYRYPSVWVPVSQLLRAMQRIDADSGRSRGLVWIRRLHRDAVTPAAAAAGPQPPETAQPPGPN